MLPGSWLSRQELLDDGLAEEEASHQRPEGEIPDIISQDAFDGACLHACSLTKAHLEFGRFLGLPLAGQERRRSEPLREDRDMKEKSRYR